MLRELIITEGPITQTAVGLAVNFSAINHQVARMVGAGEISPEDAVKSYDQTIGELARIMSARGTLPALKLEE